MRNKTTASLKFEQHLVPIILASKKSCTWRLWNDKELKVGDKIVLISKPNDKPFAKAEIVSIKETKMGRLNRDDKFGHEPFDSEKEMYSTYQRYYKKHVEPNTPVTVIHFKLLGRTILT